MQAAYEKLTYPDMQPQNAKIADYMDACILSQQIRARADILIAKYESLDNPKQKRSC